jgi:mono/diheme cytochrome c family protein
MRPHVYGTIAREMEIDPSIATGRAQGQEGWELDVPRKVLALWGGSARMVDRGKDRYTIYCAPCHADSGDGRGMVVRRAQRDPQAGALKPPSFHDERLRHAPDGQFFSTISNGIRNMPAYRHNIPVADRWAIVAYIRALQFSQLPTRTAMNETPQGGQP